MNRSRVLSLNSPCGERCNILGDRVWRAFTDPAQLSQWWCRGNKLVIETFELKRGGHWRFVEHANGEVHGFEGRYAEITPQEKLVFTFEWDGLPGHTIYESTTFEDLGGRTRVVTTSLFFTTDERNGMMASGMEGGLNESYEALDRLLAA